MGVVLKFTGKCKNCGHADLSLNERYAKDFYGNTVVIWGASCSHESVCDMWDDRLSEEKERNI